ncbi:nitrogenase cofactor biosynthesis protein NifB [Dethiobacter alkaliphilus]|uniref:nitrogenase cofactor biosynthesis protein NifB n=1 Tax=Dethiobacter alkaliphilus TaxID=427926 RepID=UPI002227D3DC|nr:nitrogenase cofactor biosynthesis protein NifB [Dethiobacter alkaliphilus]MCW3490779.1 nitrogenase cofactor biosynthesis protein NifB [Dethiobacter alkaliphilus]
MKCQSACLAEKELSAETQRHPCYSFAGHKKYARMHIPVAPRCNLACNYCNRRFDCVNESRPGVTSEILTPQAALDKYSLVKKEIPNLSVVGIAGPGDSLADWEKTRKSIELIKARDEDTIICLSTNGLLLPELAPELLSLGVKHVTVTVNSIDPKIGALIYRHVRYKDETLTGKEGAELLINNQLTGIKILSAHGVLVKVNIVMIKGVNDNHIQDVVKTVKELGASITNIMPLIPAPGSVFAHHEQTSNKDLEKMRQLCETDLPQMRHCQQCRADAIGLLHEDRSAEFSRSEPYPKKPNVSETYKIAVASKYGKRVDLHFGHATQFHIYRCGSDGFTLLEKRGVEQYCLGVEECGEEEERREIIIQSLADCDAVLTLRIGYHAQKRLLEQGILPVENCDKVNNGLLFTMKELAQKESA